MPVAERANFIKNLESDSGIKCNNNLDFPICPCGDDYQSKFPDLRYVFNGKPYYIPQEAYVYRNSDTTCQILLIQQEGDDEWMLGLNFFTNYYTVYDQTNMKVGFAPSIKAPESLLQLVKGINPPLT